MGYCNGNCEYLTTRHNCEKYKKKLTYSRFSGGGLDTGTIHERCSECDKDRWIAELEQQVNIPALTSFTQTVFPGGLFRTNSIP